MNCRYCDQPPKHKGLLLCGTHHQRWLRAGKPDLSVWDGEPTTTRLCVVCGNSFRPIGSQVTCSDECATEHRRALDRAHYHQSEARKEASRRRNERLKQVRRAGGAAAEALRAADRARKPAQSLPVRACTRCGRKYAPTRKDQRLCRRDDCLAIGRRANRSKVLTCAVCLQSFHGRTGQQYCSEQCRSAAYRIEQRLTMREAGIPLEMSLAALAVSGEMPGPKYTSECRQCGELFRTDAAHAKFCSPECRRQSLTQRKRRGKASIPTWCAVCGESFLASKRNAKTCSPDCRRRYKVQLERQRMESAEVKERARVNARKRHGVKATCKICGKDMTALPNLRTNRYTCSPDCRREAMRRKNRRSYEKRRGNSTG